jgi:hypothetical protein
MEKQEATKLIDKLEIPEEKRAWLEQYVEYHIEADKNPVEEVVKPTQDFAHFEVHDVMKTIWKDRNKNVY